MNPRLSVCLCLCLWSAPAAAQQGGLSNTPASEVTDGAAAADSQTPLSGSIGKVVRVHDDTGRIVTGRLLTSSASQLAVRTSAPQPQTFDLSRVRLVTHAWTAGEEMKAGSRVAMILGGGVGGAIGAVACSESCNPLGPAASVAAGAAVGTLSGMLVGGVDGGLVHVIRNRGTTSRSHAMFVSALLGAAAGALVGAAEGVGCCNGDVPAIEALTASVAALGAGTATILAARREPVLFKQDSASVPGRFTAGAVFAPTSKALVATLRF